MKSVLARIFVRFAKACGKCGGSGVCPKCDGQGIGCKKCGGDGQCPDCCGGMVN